MIVKAGATLRLSAGAYRFASFDAEPQSVVNVSRDRDPHLDLYVTGGDVILAAAERSSIRPAAAAASWSATSAPGRSRYRRRSTAPSSRHRPRSIFAPSAGGIVDSSSARNIKLGPTRRSIFKAFACQEP